MASLLNVFFEAVVHGQCRDSAVIQRERKAKKKKKATTTHAVTDKVAAFFVFLKCW